MESLKDHWMDSFQCPPERPEKGDKASEVAEVDETPEPPPALFQARPADLTGW